MDEYDDTEVSEVTGGSEGDAGWCAADDGLGVDTFGPGDAGADPGSTDGGGGDDAVDDQTDEPGDLAVDLFDETVPEGRGTVLRDDGPGELGPVGFRFGELAEFVTDGGAPADTPLSPIEDRELAAHAEQAEALHGVDLEHAELEHDFQQSFDARASSPVWLHPDDVANSECGMSEAVADEIDRANAAKEHADAEQRAAANLLPDEVAAHMQELDTLGQETNVAHSSAEVAAQQSQPLQPKEYEPPPGSGSYWGIRVVGGASVSKPGVTPGPSFEKAVYEIKNLTTGEVGVFDAIGGGYGVGTPGADIGTGDWAFFRTGNDQQLSDFAGRASIGSTTLCENSSTIRFADPDSSLPLIGDIDVEHDNLLDSIALGDSVDISDSAVHAGLELSVSVVNLGLVRTYWDEPAPDLVDVVREAVDSPSDEP